MKAISILLVLGSAALASAQSQCASLVSAIPTCGNACLSSAEAAVGCSPGDLACPCSSSQAAAIQSAAIECVISACGAVTGLAVSSAALAVCSCVATAAPASTSASSTAASSTASSSVAASSSSAATITATTTTPSGYGSGNSTATSSLSVFTGGAARVIGAGGAIVGGFIGVMAVL